MNASDLLHSAPVARVHSHLLQVGSIKQNRAMSVYQLGKEKLLLLGASTLCHQELTNPQDGYTSYMALPTSHRQDTLAQRCEIICPNPLCHSSVARIPTLEY